MNRTAILFDHDGTLVDSFKAVVTATNMSLKKKRFSGMHSGNGDIRNERPDI